MCERTHRSQCLRMERDSSKCDQCQHDLEGGRRWVMGVRVTAARGVSAPSQGRGERCLRVRLGPAGAPALLAEVRSQVSGTFQRMTPRRFTGHKQGLQLEESRATAAANKQLSILFFFHSLFIRECVSLLIWGNRCPYLCLFCCHGPGSISRQSDR